MYQDTQLLIGGVWSAAQDGRTQPVLNPATGQQIGTVAHASVADLDRAVAAAVQGFEVWRKVSAFERYKLMRKAAELVRERADSIATLMTLEQGKPLTEARMETLAGADIIDWMAEEGRRAYGRVIPARAEGVYQLVLKEPVGPVAAFTPWNFPINQAVRKLSAALATGCSIVIKAPEETPAAPAALVRAFVDAGLPAGVVNLVYGSPAEVSGHLIPHPAIRKVTFTGSTAVGKQLAALAGQHMKRVTMELGGHAPVVVLDDADLDAAARILVANKFRNAGQVCVSPTRFIVQDGVFDSFLDKFVALTRQIKVGDGLAAGTTMGPLANRRRVAAMQSYIEDATRLGARIATGGHALGGEGNFFEPTVLADVPTHARVMNEEPFGPLALFVRVADLDAAMAEANRLPFGLASYAYTRSVARAQAIGARMEAGMLSINHHGLALPETPFGGIKDSGYGSEGGSEALEAYLNTKFVTQTGL